MKKNRQTVLHILFLGKYICSTSEEWKYLTIDQWNPYRLPHYTDLFLAAVAGVVVFMKKQISFLFRCPCFYKCKTLEFQNTIKILSLYRFWFNLFYKLHHSFNSSWQIRSCSHMLSAILKETEHNCLRETACVSKVWIWKPSIWSCWHLSELYLIEKKMYSTFCNSLLDEKDNKARENFLHPYLLKSKAVPSAWSKYLAHPYTCMVPIIY